MVKKLVHTCRYNFFHLLIIFITLHAYANQLSELARLCTHVSKLASDYHRRLPGNLSAARNADMLYQLRMAIQIMRRGFHTLQDKVPRMLQPPYIDTLEKYLPHDYLWI